MDTLACCLRHPDQVTAAVAPLLPHMAAPPTCFGAGDHLGLDAHERQVGNVNLAADVQTILLEEAV